MSYQKLWIFTNFKGKAFWKGTRTVLTFGLDDFAQREAVAFSDNCRIYITSEKNTVGGVTVGGNLSTLNVCDYLTTKTKEIAVNAPKIRAYPTPSVNDVFLQLEDVFSENLMVSIYNANGTLLSNQTIKAGETQLALDNQLFTSAGFYLFKVFSEKKIPLSMGKIFIIR